MTHKDHVCFESQAHILIEHSYLPKTSLHSIPFIYSLSTESVGVIHKTTITSSKRSIQFDLAPSRQRTHDLRSR